MKKKMYSVMYVPSIRVHICTYTHPHIHAHLFQLSAQERHSGNTHTHTYNDARRKSHGQSGHLLCRVVDEFSGFKVIAPISTCT